MALLNGVHPIKLARLCAILLLVSSSPSPSSSSARIFSPSRRAIQLVGCTLTTTSSNCATANKATKKEEAASEDGEEEEEEAAANKRPPPGVSPLHESSPQESARVTSRNHVALPETLNTNEAPKVQGEHKTTMMRQLSAGKIHDYATNSDSLHHHHSLTPRLLSPANSTVLARLIVASQLSDRQTRPTGSVVVASERTTSGGSPPPPPSPGDKRQAKCVRAQARSRHFGDVLRGKREAPHTLPKELQSRARLRKTYLSCFGFAQLGRLARYSSQLAAFRIGKSPPP